MDDRSLAIRIGTLRAQVRRLLALHGVGRVVGLSVPLVVLAGLADWLIHLDAGVRLAFLLGLLGFTAWRISRDVVAPLVVRFADLDIAMRIEARWPGLNDRLASTVQFLAVAGGDEDRHGSRELREETVRQTMEETRSIDFRQIVAHGPARKALGLAGAALAMTLALVVADPGLSRIGVRRLFLPFGADRWPRQTHLSLLDKETPRKVARGEPFTLAVAVAKGDRPPSSARASFRFEDGETLSVPLRTVEGGVFRGRIESVERSFTFSVAAGDDSASVRDVAVKVVPPPSVTDLKVRLVAPEYTGLGPQTLAPGVTQVKAVEGTRVEVEARTNKPIERATLRLGEKSAADPVKIDRAGTGIKAGFTLTESSPFGFDLLDTEGFRGRAPVRYDARAVRDEAPRVVIDDPANDRDVPARATVPVLFTADDDYGLQSARLVFKTATGGSEPTQEIVLPLWDSAHVPGPAGKRVRRQQVRHDWDLAPLKLPPGSVITFHADARDFDTTRGPKLGKSRQLRLRIMTDEEIARQVDDARRAIREDVEAILGMQNQARTPVDEALRSLAGSDRLNNPAHEDLKNAEMIQRQVGNRITSKADGLDQKISRFLEDLKNFKTPNPDAQKQMQEMSAGVARVRENHLGPAEQGLTRSSKNLGEPSASAPPDRKQDARPEVPPAKTEPRTTEKAATPSEKKAPAGGEASPNADKTQDRAGDPSKTPPKAAGAPAPGEPRRPADAARASLAEAQTHQKAIAGELQKMLDGLSEFETYRGVVKDAQTLLKEHEQVMKQTSEAASKPDLMGKTPDQLSPEQKADLANLGARQGNVAKGAQNLQEKLGQMGKRLSDSDPLASSAMNEAAAQLKKKDTVGKLGEAADKLDKNQMGAARSTQEKARQDLKDLVDAIQNRRERELARLVRELKNAEAELEKVRGRQTKNLEKTRAARKDPDPKAREKELKRLAKEQAEIQKQLESQLKRLAKLSADSAAQAGAKAAGKMAQARENLDGNQGDQAEKQEDDALADLEDAQDKLQQTRRQAEEQLAMEQLSKMGDRLKGMADRQEKVAAETADYEKLRAAREGKLTIAQRAGVRGLAGVQEAIKDETADLIERLEGAPVFALTLKRASEGMDAAAQRLQTLRTDEITQRAARAAAARFKQLLDALKPEKPKNGGPQQGGGGGGGGGGGDGIPPAAQLKMLKGLQEEINERTEYFDELKRRGKELAPAQVAEIDRLQTDQGTLADLVRDLTRPKTDDVEE